MKKVISMILAVGLMISTVAPVAAATADSVKVASTSSATLTNKGLENAIRAVKEKIDIPKECNKFTYNVYTQNDITYWSFGWSNEEIQKYINVTIDENNLITSYSSYQYNGYEKRIPKYSKEQGQKIAEKFINNIDKSLMSQYKLIDDNNYMADREYYFNYIRQVNGIEYNANNIVITVNNYSGEVTNFNLSYSKNTKFEDASKIISLDQAKKAFLDKLGLKLVYNVKTENDKPVTYLAYIPKNTNKYIDAITGETETFSGISDIYYTAAMDQKTMVAGAANSNIVLTPEEIEAVKGMSDILSKEDVDKKVRSISLFNLGSDFTLSSANLNKDWRNKDSLIWSLNYTTTDKTNERNVQVSVDANTGDIISFWTYYSSAEGAKPQKTKDQAKAICDDVLKSLIPNYYSKVKYDDTYYNYYENNQNQFTFRYVRVENGLECPSNNITITFDNLSGKVININTDWTKNLTFADTKNVITLDAANKVLFDKIGYKVRYVNDTTTNNLNEKIVMPVPADAGNAVLGYFIDNTKPNVISAATGDILDFSGNVYKENNVADYTDIKGIYGEDQVKILTQLGIKYKENELKPNDNLLQKDYFILLCRLNDIYYVDPNFDDEKDLDRMYNGLISQGIITKAEKAPLSTLTREEAAKYFVKFLKLSQVAEIKGIYKSDFKDSNKINPDLLGYVCIASGLKVMNGTDGNFLPKNKITRLEGLLTIYSYLSNK